MRQTGVKILECPVTSNKWRVTQMAGLDKEIYISRSLREKNHLAGAAEEEVLRSFIIRHSGNTLRQVKAFSVLFKQK